MCSQCALVISHHDSVVSLLLQATFHLAQNLIILIKYKKAKHSKKCDKQKSTSQNSFVICSLHYHNFRVSVAFKNRNENKPLPLVPLPSP